MKTIVLHVLHCFIHSFYTGQVLSTIFLRKKKNQIFYYRDRLYNLYTCERKKHDK